MPPFLSTAQSRKCFALKAKGKAKGWNCEEWAQKTNYKVLPSKAKKSKYGSKK